MNQVYLTRRRAAEYVRANFGMRCSEKWLAKLAVTGGGPCFWKDGRTVLYRPYDLDAWVAARVSGPFPSSSSHLAALRARSRRWGGMPFVDVDTLH